MLSHCGLLQLIEEGKGEEEEVSRELGPSKGLCRPMFLLSNHLPDVYIIVGKGHVYPGAGSNELAGRIVVFPQVSERVVKTGVISNRTAPAITVTSFSNIDSLRHFPWWGGGPGLCVALVYCFRVGILGFGKVHPRLDAKVPTWCIIPHLPAAGPCVLNILEEGRKPISCCAVIGRCNHAVSTHKMTVRGAETPISGFGSLDVEGVYFSVRFTVV